MKKVILILLVLLLTGCGNEEVTIKNPDGRALTYQYFSENKYDNSIYNLKLKDGNSIITIKKNNDDIYYEVIGDSTLILIEKGGYRYTLDTINKTYNASSITQSLNYAEGILPPNLDKLKNKSYKTGEDKINSFKYTYETYKFGDIKTTYYFDDKKLKFIKKEIVALSLCFYKLIILLLHKKQAEYYLLFYPFVLHVFGSCSYNCLHKQYMNFSLLAT